MKRAWGLFLFLAVLLLFSAALADVEISESVFPDEGFRQYIFDAGFDENADGLLSRAEIAKVTCIDCHSRKIRSLQGIETFTELIELQCYDNLLTEVDVSRNGKLASLGVYLNQLTKMDLSGSKNLVSFSCSGNPVSELILPDTRNLTWVDLTWTNLQSLEIGNYPLLEKLVRSGEPTRYIYAETEEQINWISDTSFLAVSRQFTLKANGAVLYDGSGSAEAAAESAETAETPETPVESAEKQQKTETGAKTGGKKKIARLLKPTFDGGYNTIWMSVPENFTLRIIGQDDVPGYTISEGARDFMAGVLLETERGQEVLHIHISITVSGRWMEYGSLSGIPDNMMDEVEAYYLERFSEDWPIEVEVYEFSGGIKVLQHLKDPISFQAGKHFIGWTMLNGYEINVRCWISDNNYYGFPPPPREEDLETVGMVLSSLEIIED